MKYTELVERLADELRRTIPQLQADGTGAMSQQNLMQLISFRGVFANLNTRTRAFDDALSHVLQEYPRFQVTR